MAAVLPPNQFQSFDFTSGWRKSSSLERPNSPTSTTSQSDLTTSRQHSADLGTFPPLSPGQRNPSHGRRRSSIFSFLSKASSSTFGFKSHEEYADEPLSPTSTQDSRSSSRRSSIWSRRRSSSNRKPSEDLSEVAHAMAPKVLTSPESRKNSQDTSSIGPLYPPSHEISFLDSVIPEEGLLEEDEYVTENHQLLDQATSLENNGNNPISMNIEWFNNEEDARKRTAEIMRGRATESAHWLHSAASASSEDLAFDLENGNEKENEDTTAATKSTRTKGIFEKLSNMAGLTGSSSSGSWRMYRDGRSNSVPVERRRSKKPSTSKEQPKNAPKDEILDMTFPIKRERSKSVAFADKQEDEDHEASGTRKSMLNGYNAKTGNSMWDTFHRRKTKAFNIFSQGRGEYMAVAAN